MPIFYGYRKLLIHSELVKSKSYRMSFICAIMSHIQSHDAEKKVSHIFSHGRQTSESGPMLDDLVLYPLCNRDTRPSFSRSRVFTRTGRAWLLPPASPVAFVYLTGYKSRSLSWSRVLTIVVR
jgi:hypothetical protein